MSSPSPLDFPASEHLEVKEEEEELGALSSSPSSATLAKTTRNGDTSPFAMRAPHARRGTEAVSGESDDEFAMDISFVPTRGNKKHSSADIFIPPSTSSSAHFRAAAPTLSTQASTSLPKKTSIASKWNSEEGETLGNYKGSDMLDDTDRANDAAEFQAWRQRDFRRRKDLLA